MFLLKKFCMVAPHIGLCFCIIFAFFFFSFNPEFSNTQIKIEDDDEDISQSSFGAPQLPLKEPKKRGRPKKIKDDKYVYSVGGGGGRLVYIQARMLLSVDI